MERKSLYASVAANGLLCVLGFIFFFFTDSEAILLDGVFNIISLAMGFLSLKVVQLLLIPEDSRYHFGYVMFEPLLNTIKGLIITFVCLLSLISALDTLIEGGKPLNFGFGLIYIVIAVTGAFSVYFYQNKKSKTINSPLLEVEAKNWFINGALIGVVGLAFLISFFLQGTSFEYITPYADPVLILVLVSLAPKVPISTIRDNLNQLMKQAPDDKTQEEIHLNVDEILINYPINESVVRMVHIGRIFYVLLQLFVDPDSELTVTQEDVCRDQVFSKLKSLNNNVVLDVIFTKDKKWIK